MSDGILATVDSWLLAHRQQGLAGLEAFLAIPSISALPAHAPDGRRAASFLAERLGAAGFHGVTLLETGGAPAVYGEWLQAPGRPTALVYGHYDVQPVDPEGLWTSPPFAPTTRQGRLYARGAADDKGQVWMHLLVAEAFLRTQGALPVNLKVLVEGEEEVGSRHLPALVAAEKRRLAADVVVISDSSFLAPGLPSVAYGLRGLCAMELHVYGAARDLHSGEYGGAVQNPLHALASLVAGLHGADGRVAVPGFYDGVRPIPAEERAALAALPFDAEAALRAVGVSEGFGEPGYTALERTTLRPTLEVNGMWGGFTGAGSKTVIPAAAHAKITCRLVPDQDPERVLAAVAADLERRCPRGVRLEVETHGGHPATLVPRDAPVVRPVVPALRDAFGREPVWTRMGGSIGVVPAFAHTLGAPVVLMGFGLPDDNIHAPDESFDLGQYARGQQALASYWWHLAQADLGRGGQAPDGA
jgi:acetylornithine deacetylase/succinyl-diaminopimelate desuccinylase-like protein